jgi:hypothetical protein
MSSECGKSITGDHGPDVDEAPTCGVGGQVEPPTFRSAGRRWLATGNKVLPLSSHLTLVRSTGSIEPELVE